MNDGTFTLAMSEELLFEQRQARKLKQLREENDKLQKQVGSINYLRSENTRLNAKIREAYAGIDSLTYKNQIITIEHDFDDMPWFWVGDMQYWSLDDAKESIDRFQAKFQRGPDWSKVP